MLDYLNILHPEQAVKVPFPHGVPHGVESSIYRAATRKRMRVSVYIRSSAVYVCRTAPCEPATASPRKYCVVCGAILNSKPGTGKQFVCAGSRKKKSECQKVWRYAREHRMSVEDAMQRRFTERGIGRAGAAKRKQ